MKKILILGVNGFIGHHLSKRILATSGSTVSHLRMWYSIHSLLMVMSPSKKWKRGSPSSSATRSFCMSMP